MLVPTIVCSYAIYPFQLHRVGCVGFDSEQLMHHTALDPRYSRDALQRQGNEKKAQQKRS